MPEPTTPLAERPWEDVERLLGVDEALERILHGVVALPIVDLPLLDALGLVLAEDLIAPANVPPFRNSAMDGYAVRTEDTSRARPESPVTLPISGMIAAGFGLSANLPPGTAMRIMTGAMMPGGADAVVRFEETDEFDRPAGPDRDTVSIARAPSLLDNVREAGEDIRQGDMVLRAGRVLTAADLGIHAALGLTSARVVRRPRVAIISTGDEVVEPGGILPPGKIRNSNTTTLAAFARSWGAEVETLGIAADTLDGISDRLARAASADVIVTSGGVSMGDYDFVKDALRQHGEIAIWQVRMKPGKPLAFGHVGKAPLLGLPGNPVAAAISMVVFGRPLIRRMLGLPESSTTAAMAVLAESIDNRGMRRHYVRVQVSDENGEWVARTAGSQGAGVLSSLSRANALLVIPETTELAEPGQRFPFIPMDESAVR